MLLSIDFQLPFKSPVLIFSLLLFIILFAPILFNKIKIPHIIGLIISGVLIGPYGFNFLQRDASIILYGTVGLLYIMFLAGLEIDMGEFKRNRKHVLVFGLFTFILPFVAGTLGSYYLLGNSLLSSMLLASMFSTHTLVSYPIAGKYGVTRHRSVAITVGGTMITDIIALLILAAIVGVSKQEVSTQYWVTLSISVLVFVAIIFFLLPVIIRWFFIKFQDSVSQYIFVLAIVFLSGFLAELAGVEAIIGAFFSGLVLNKFIPHSSPLMSRISFVGNALFIPIFLISVGMLVDVKVLYKGWGALKVAGVIITIAIFTKWLAAYVMQKIFRMSKAEGNMIFGLSTAHAAATLAIILVGYSIITGETANGEPIRLLNEDVLNGTILLILVSCGVSSIVVERASRQLAMEQHADDSLQAGDTSENIMVSLGYENQVASLVDLAVSLKTDKINSSVYAVKIVADEEDETKKSDEKISVIKQAQALALQSEVALIPVIRYDQSIHNGIVYSIKQHNVDEVILGMHQMETNSKKSLGENIEHVLENVGETVYIYNGQQPLNTLSHMKVAVPPYAEMEPGFVQWCDKLLRMAKNYSIKTSFYGNPNSILQIKQLALARQHSTDLEFIGFDKWNHFSKVFEGVGSNQLLVVVSSRKGHISYSSHLNEVADILRKEFDKVSTLMIFPAQLETGINMSNIEQSDYTLLETLSEKIGSTGKYLLDILNRKKSQ